MAGTRTDLQAPSPGPARQQKNISGQESTPKAFQTDVQSLIIPLGLCHLSFPSPPSPRWGRRGLGPTRDLHHPQPSSLLSLLPQQSASDAGGDCHPGAARFPACSCLQGGAGARSCQRLALTLNVSLYGPGDGAGHSSVLLGNDHGGKRKFAARAVVKGSGPHPFFIFSSCPFFSSTFISATNAVCQLSRTCCPQTALWSPSGIQLWPWGAEGCLLCPAGYLGPARVCLLWGTLP